MTTDQQSEAAAEQNDLDAAEYRALSPWAVIALVLGLISATAFVSPVLWIVPVLGLSAAAMALRQIRASENEMTGRRAALWGLGLSVAFGIGAVADRGATSWRLEAEATAFATLWFDHLQHDRPHLAHQLTLEPHRRRGSGDGWAQYREQPEARVELEGFTADKPIRALLALDERATVRLYQTEAIRSADRGRHFVGQLYAVTYDHQGVTTTFFLRIAALRTLERDTKTPSWKITSWQAGVRPQI